MKFALPLLSLILIVSALLNSHTLEAESASPSTRPASEPNAAKPIWGVYTGNDVKPFEQYEQWLGHPADAILIYTGDANWKDYEGSVGWIAGRLAPLDRRGLWSVALIPREATLAEAAKGSYNDHYKKIAEKIAKWRPDDPVLYIRTAWEFNGNWFHYKAVGQNENFIGAWRQFVGTFRSVSKRFQFDWCPSGAAKLAMNAEDAYPGDDYVDVIGLDIYNQEKWCKIKDPVERFNKIYMNGDHGLVWHRDFAKKHGKPMSYPEWGSGGNASGDDPYFVEQMHKWFLENHVIYATYWNSNSSYTGRMSGNEYPNAGAKYKELFGHD